MNPRYPIMAALLVAFPGSCWSLGAHAGPHKVSQPAPTAAPACPPKVAGETEPVNILSALIACGDQAKADIGERLARFVLSVDGAKPRFVAKAIQDDASRADAIATDAKNWVKSGRPGEAAELYFVVGDGEPPAWVKANAVLKETVKAGTEEEGDWRKGFVAGLLTRWHEGGQGKIGWENHSRDVGLFLSDAAAAATKKRMEKRSPEGIRTDVAQNEQDMSVPGGPGGKTRSLAAGPQFTYEDMYLRGGASGHVSGPNDKEKAPYNLKLETQADPKTHELKTYVAIYDVSETPCYVRRVPITAMGENAVSHAPGRWDLILDIKGKEGGDLSITLRRPDDKEGAEALKTSASELARARYDQAAVKNQVVDVGGKSFFVLGQGSGKDGTHLFFDASLATDPAASWRELKPALLAVTSKVGADGDFVPVTHKPKLGKVDGKDYRLELEGGRWVVKDGPGEDPPAPAATADSTKTAPPGDKAAEVKRAIAEASAIKQSGQTTGGDKATTVASSAGDEPLRAQLEINAPGAFIKLARAKMDHADEKQAAAALYKRTDVPEAEEQWHLYFKYREKGAKDVRRASVLVFSRIPADNREPAPPLDKLGVRGHLGDADAVESVMAASVKPLPENTAERGVWALLRAPASQVAPSNCVGPVLWWGMSYEDAYAAACKKGKL